MNVVPLTAIPRKRRRRRPCRGSDRIALRRTQRNAADRRADLAQLIIETNPIQQPGSVWMDRDSRSDFPENFGLLEYLCIETSRPKRKRSSQASDPAADNCDAKRARHYSDPCY